MPKELAKLFEVEQAGAVVIVIPQADLSEFAFQQLDMLDRVQASGVIIDCHKSNYFGSTAMGFFMKLWLRVRRCGGRMAFCNMSDNEKEILHVTKADSLWTVCASRKEALAAVGA
jgi:anti-anti-sigma factor